MFSSRIGFRDVTLQYAECTAKNLTRNTLPCDRRKDKGGISFSSNVKEPKVDLEAAKAVCAEYRIHNADIFMAEVSVKNTRH